MSPPRFLGAAEVETFRPLRERAVGGAQPHSSMRIVTKDQDLQIMENTISLLPILTISSSLGYNQPRLGPYDATLGNANRSHSSK